MIAERNEAVDELAGKLDCYQVDMFLPCLQYLDSERVRIGSNGRFVIPAAFRKALGVGEGDELLVRMEGGDLRITSVESAISHAQELIRRYVPEGTRLVDELISERREAADLER